MELFSKKYDRVKDSLVIEFDLEKKCFYFSKSGEIISYEKLNKKTKLFLDLMNEQLKDPTYLSSVIAQKETENAIIDSQERMDFLSSIGYSNYGFRNLVGTTLCGTISDEVLEFLNEYIKNEHILLCIHRVKDTTTDALIEDTLLNGLQYYGHHGGMIISNVKLENHVSYYESNKFIINELILANGYKNSSGSILISIPFEDLGKDLFIRNNDDIRLNPKYIVGYFPVSNRQLDLVVTPEDIKNCINQRKLEGDPYILGETVARARKNIQQIKSR